MRGSDKTFYAARRSSRDDLGGPEAMSSEEAVEQVALDGSVYTGPTGSWWNGDRRSKEMDVNSGKEWRGSPLDLGGGIDPYGIKEIVVEYDTGNEDILKPQLRDEYGSYECSRQPSIWGL